MFPSTAGAPDLHGPLRSFVDAELDRLLRKVAGIRATASPLLMLLAGVVVWADPAPWRRAVVGTVAMMAMVGALWSARQVRLHGISRHGLAANLVAMAVFQVVMVAATGGLESPLLPVLLPLSIAAGLLIGRQRALLPVLATQLGGLALLLIGQLSGILDGLRLDLLATSEPWGAAHLLTVFGVMCTVVIGGGMLGTVLRGTVEERVIDVLAARDAQLHTLVDHARDLEVLSGEIAHELKNPLASIKGLGALLARDVPPGRATERLSVMRGEIDRMQGIIEEFLTFSRPLSPLTLDAVEPAALCQHVAALHEADALKRSVVVHVSAQGPVLRGDARKLSQVLVNLLQNALDASPSGASVEISAQGVDGEVLFEVADRGAGPPEALGERVFEPGVSGKAGGSGLGLTIARALTHQHGGQLDLLARPGGGTRAVLRLPVGGPP